MIKLERTLALHIVISPVAKSIVGADDNLLSSLSILHFFFTMRSRVVYLLAPTR